MMIGTTSYLGNIVGFVAAVVSVLLGSVYLIAIVVGILKEGLAFPPAKSIQFVGAIVSILSGIDLIVLMVALKPHIVADRQLLVDISIIFMALLCGATSINRYVQLAIVPQFGDPENHAIIQLIHPYGPKSIMFAIESLGWGLFYGLAALFCGFCLDWQRVVFLDWFVIHYWGCIEHYLCRRSGYPATHPEFAGISCLGHLIAGRVDLACD